MIGQTVSHYHILDKLGEGGMGVVYKAQDTKLDRPVALKFLPTHSLPTEDDKARFYREAKAAAKLNHSHIATVYEIDETDDGQAFIAMEYVEGETLREMITRGPLPLEDAFDYAIQMAEGLAAAHEAGIVHRDVKPENVILSEEGRVKILDFGLAKLQGASLLTKEGTTLGTMAYMSPEQLQAEAVDARTDIWSLGVVLYEMVTGQLPFQGDYDQALSYGITNLDPESTTGLRAGAPLALDGVIGKCLAKERERRYQHVAEVPVDLKAIDLKATGLSRISTTTSVAPGAQPTVRWRWALAFALVAVASGLVVGTAVWNLRPAAPSAPRPVRFSFGVLTVPSQQAMGGVSGRLAMSPDGTTVAYLGASPVDLEQRSGKSTRQLYLRRIAESEGRPILGTEGAQSPFFSPDGAWVGFAAAGKLQRVPIAGGAPLEICKARGIFGASWGPDDSIIFGGGIGSGLMRVAVAGGRPEPLTSPDPANGEIHHGFPEILPDGRTVLFTIGTGDGSRIAKLSLDTPGWEELLPYGAGPRYLSAGYLLFSENDNLRLVRFDAQEGRVDGSVLPALDGGILWESWAGLNDAAFSVSRSGDLAFIPGGLGSFETNLVWVDRRGKETVIDADRAFYIGPRISPDGRRIAMSRVGELGFGEIWVMNNDGDQAFPVADDGADYNPVWTQDGTTLTYTSNGDMFEKRVDRDDARIRHLRRENYQFPRSWSTDGRLLAFIEVSPNGSRIWVKPRDGEPEPLLDSSFNSGSPRFAPQGDWIAYVSDESGQEEVYVRRYPGSERGKPISRGGAREPVWSVDGRELFYRRGDQMMAVQITTEPEFEVGDPVELWEAPYFSQEGLWNNYDVAPDGRFLMLRVPDTSNTDAARIHVFLDWLTGIEDRMEASN